ncbi:MAG TPA: hypothetical protein VIM18_04045 [Solirubrobacteraceae bacterium]
MPSEASIRLFGRSARRGARDGAQLNGQVAGALLHLVGRAKGPVAVTHLLLGLVSERTVDQVQQAMVLPEADAKRDHTGERRHDQACSQLVKVTYDAEAILMADRPQRSRYALAQCIWHPHCLLVVRP